MRKRYQMDIKKSGIFSSICSANSRFFYLFVVQLYKFLCWRILLFALKIDKKIYYLLGYYCRILCIKNISYVSEKMSCLSNVNWTCNNKWMWFFEISTLRPSQEHAREICRACSCEGRISRYLKEPSSFLDSA